MFSYLYYDIFPMLGEFFGKLSAVATLSIEEFLYNFFDTFQYQGIPVYYKNLFTGVNSSFVPLGDLPNTVRRILGGISSYAFLGVPHNLPVWVGMLFACIEIYLLIALSSFVRKLIKG